MLALPVSSREESNRQAERFFEEHWKKGDPWRFESSPWEKRRFDHLLGVVADRRYPRVLEIGCGSGHFTERLLPLADSLLGLDVSPTAIEAARARFASSPFASRLELRAQNIFEAELRGAGPFDLVVLTETVYYLGWLYPFFKVAYLARDLLEATTPGGRLLLANTLGEVGDALVLPWIIRSYHDLFRNAGYETEREDALRGTKDGVEMEVLISLLRRGGSR
jgi:SAM-dependent methyltransferase